MLTINNSPRKRVMIQERNHTPLSHYGKDSGQEKMSHKQRMTAQKMLNKEMEMSKLLREYNYNTEQHTKRGGSVQEVNAPQHRTVSQNTILRKKQYHEDQLPLKRMILGQKRQTTVEAIQEQNVSNVVSSVNKSSKNYSLSLQRYVADLPLIVGQNTTVNMGNDIRQAGRWTTMANGRSTI